LGLNPSIAKEKKIEEGKGQVKGKNVSRYVCQAREEA
jgi:hypothetical protein